MVRKFVAAGNWKMNTSKKEIEKLIGILKTVQGSDSDYIVAPPSIYLDHVKSILPANFQLSAQNCYKAASGAFTGEISPQMLLDVGASWVILGHSERRHVFGETDKLVSEKVNFALASGVKVIACIGEKIEERKADKTSEVVLSQVKAIADGVTNWDNVILAYEPVWAIGTGLVATPEQAQEVHKLIREWLKDNVSKDVADKTRILYGGSVTGANCEELAKKEDVDGFLVGGASLKEDFVKICRARS